MTYPDIPGTEWVSYSFHEDRAAYGRIYAACADPYHCFKPRWLIMMTKGIRVTEAKIGMNTVVGLSATDLHHVSEWDRLVKIEQLDRVKIGGSHAAVGNRLTVWFRNEDPGTTKTVEGAWVGQQIVDGKLWPVPDDFFDPKPPQPIRTFHGGDAGRSALLAPLVEPLLLGCPECGASEGMPCFGTVRGASHPRRKVKS